jgi:xanthine/CO dehydrogenase XdhC/CoxF family maturation factor
MNYRLCRSMARPGSLRCKRVFVGLLIEGLLAAAAAKVERISVKFRFVLGCAYLHHHSANWVFTDTPIGPRTFVVIATLHKKDHLWLQKALEGNAAYVALIASRHRSRLVLDYLLATGIPAEEVEKVWAPAGLDLGAATPEEIALSIISQIVALRRGSVKPLHLKESDLAMETAADKVIHKCETDSV